MTEGDGVRELTYKQQLFVEAYLGEANGNAAEAARVAGYSSPERVGRQLLTKTGVMAQIDARLDEAALTTNQILARLSDIATGDLGDFLKIDDDGGWKLDLLKAKRKTHLIRKIKSGRQGTEIELYNSLEALTLLGKYRKLFTEKVDVMSGGDPVTVAVVEVVRPPALEGPDDRGGE